MDSQETGPGIVPTDDAPGSGRPRKKFRSYPPDVIVSVGTGDSAREFECHGFLLSRASDYFDVMLSVGMKEGELGRVDFPDGDPREWGLFYQFIHPRRIAELRHDAEIDAGNVERLLPWFHRFQMDEHVRECDRCLTKGWAGWVRPGGDWRWQPYWDRARGAEENDADYQARVGKRRERFDEAFRTMQLANTYGLASTKASVAEGMADLVKLSARTEDLLDLPVIKYLLQMVLPLQLVPGDGSRQTELRMAGDEGCKNLWPAFEEIFAPHVLSLSQEMVDDCVTFPLLVHSFLQIKIEKDRSEFALRESQFQMGKLREGAEKRAREVEASASSIIGAFVRDYPEELRARLPRSRSIGNLGRENETIDSFGVRCFKKILSRHYMDQREDFKRLCVTLPSTFHQSSDEDDAGKGDDGEEHDNEDNMNDDDGREEGVSEDDDSVVTQRL